MFNKVHVSDTNGFEAVISYDMFREELRKVATPQPTGDGGVKVIEGVSILSFDHDHLLTFVVNGTSYTMLER